MADNPTSNKDNPTGDLLLADLQKTTASLKSTLGVLISEAQVNIDEGAFVQFFLPLFAGELSKDRVKYTEALTAWYTVAGSPYAPVNVTKAGKVVAVVPPIRNNVISGKHTGQVKDVGTILDDVAHLRELAPQAARGRDGHELLARFLTRIPRPDLSAEQKAWFDLLNKYGKAPEALSAQVASHPAAKAAVKPAGSDPDDFFEL